MLLNTLCKTAGIIAGICFSFFLLIISCTKSPSEMDATLIAPSEIVIQRCSQDSVFLNWIDESSNESGFLILSMMSPSDMICLDSLPPNSTSGKAKCLLSDSICFIVGVYCTNGNVELSGEYIFNDWPQYTAPDYRWIDHGDYIEDTLTGLLWQKDGMESGLLNFYQAAEYAENSTLGGMTEWRVPASNELKTIFPAVINPFINTPYTNKPYGTGGVYEWASYWTCEFDSSMTDYASVYHWYATGGANKCYASRNYVYVRCVHDPG